MSDLQQTGSKEVALAVTRNSESKFRQWLEDPMGQVVIASVATMGTLGIVLSSIWAINAVIG